MLISITKKILKWHKDIFLISACNDFDLLKETNKLKSFSSSMSSVLDIKEESALEVPSFAGIDLFSFPFSPIRAVSGPFY